MQARRTVPAGENEQAANVRGRGEQRQATAALEPGGGGDQGAQSADVDEPQTAEVGVQGVAVPCSQRQRVSEDGEGGVVDVPFDSQALPGPEPEDPQASLAELDDRVEAFRPVHAHSYGLAVRGAAGSPYGTETRSFI